MDAPKTEAPKEPTKKEAAATKAARCLSVRMAPALAREIIGLAQARLPVPTDLGDFLIEDGARLLLREWAGAPTGRADLVRVVDAAINGLIVERAWCWHQGKIDDDVSAFGLVLVPNIFAKVGFD